jgi:RimJ/RimL family protein N-acetyltransferase
MVRDGSVYVVEEVTMRTEQRRTGDESTLKQMRNLYNVFIWYLKKHGFMRLAKLACIKAWNHYFDNREVVFFFDLCREDLDTAGNEKGLYVQAYKTADFIPHGDMDQLIQIKGEAVLSRFLVKWFGRGATLWLAKLDGKVVGLQWTLIGGFGGFYSVPISSIEAILFIVEVFPNFRGLNINSRMTRLTLTKLRDEGVSRVYCKVHRANTSSLRSFDKTGAKRIGTVRTISMFNRCVNIWDKKSKMGCS